MPGRHRWSIGALAAAGALGGLAGAIMLQGDQYYLTSGFSSGSASTGWSSGLLARGSATAVVAGVALLFGFLRSGGIVDGDQRPGAVGAIVVVCQGLIVVAIARRRRSLVAEAQARSGMMTRRSQVVHASTLRLAMPLCWRPPASW